ncbi:MAG: hypothetical protein M1837_003340 [Sclerophora amabilis]|nr:MAG: hypothetical protein M1837_003340 [Sclerophora amabilis]
MATRPTIQVSGLPPVTEGEAIDTASPAEGRAERKNAVLRRLRPPEFKHEWEFWHDRYASETAKVAAEGKESESGYEDHLRPLFKIKDVQKFWEVNNNFPYNNLQLRDSVHLFKKTVKPVWEDPRNVRGGSWTFRIHKSVSLAAWTNLQLMAIGEALGDVVEKGDDICGVTLSVRFNSHLISVWNRDGSNQKSIDAIAAKVVGELPEDMRPSQSSIYYKRHSEHKGFQASAPAPATSQNATSAGP